MAANGNVGIGTTNPQFRISTGAGDTIGTAILRFATLVLIWTMQIMVLKFMVLIMALTVTILKI